MPNPHPRWAQLDLSDYDEAVVARALQLRGQSQRLVGLTSAERYVATKQMHETGWTDREIGQVFGVTNSAIQAYRRRYHLNGDRPTLAALTYETEPAGDGVLVTFVTGDRHRGQALLDGHDATKLLAALEAGGITRVTVSA